jgi:hypothetical protein
MFMRKLKQQAMLFFFSLMKRSKNHPTAQNCAKNLMLKLKSFNSSATLKDFYA